MSKPIIEIKGISKKYALSHQTGRSQYTALRDKLSPGYLFKKLTGKLPEQTGLKEEFWALKDVSFEVQQGEAVGIIGRNGAGKSTLLKVLSKIVSPTEGEIVLRGRVASLLEVGTGFHPELTGRENIYLNGAILGMRRKEIDRKFDEIVDFSGVEKFLDTPVKRYSSGMYVRLAFAVAANLESEILIVDEVLAVGDAEFQKKCLGKMQDVAQNQGRTVLFVSHNLGAIARLCKNAIWVDKGTISACGAANEIITVYQSKYLTASPEWKSEGHKEPDKEFSFLRVSLIDSDGTVQGHFNADVPIRVEVTYEVHSPLNGCQIGARICNSEGQAVFTTADSDHTGFSAMPKEPGQYRAVFTIPGNFLVPGTYYILIASHLPNRAVYDVIEQAAVFEVSLTGSLLSFDGRSGFVTPMIHWECFREHYV